MSIDEKMCDWLRPSGPLLSCGLMLMAGGQAGAAAVVNPETQPTLTLAPYVAKNDDLSLGPTNAYRPWFENGAWQGDMIEYDLDSSGTRETDVPVGANPAESGINNWSARARFDALFPPITVDVPVSENWKNRAAYTVSEDGQATILFRWGLLGTTQREELDPDTAALGTTGAYDSPVLNYILGDQSQERDKAEGIYRIRYNQLGAVINSRPAYAAYPTDSDPYATERVFVGANDGMLHAFDAKTGNEVWAYVPSMLLGKLERHGIVPYNIVYMVDGELRLSNVVTAIANGVSVRKRVLTGGLGAGGKGLFALDVDSPDAPSVLWELSGSDPDIGYIHGRPNVAPVPLDGGGRVAAVLTGNGYGSVGGRAVLLKIGLDGSVDKVVLDNGPNNGLSSPTLIDLNNDGVVDFAYAGDLKGNLWRVDLATNSAVKLFAAGDARPITVEPELARLPSGRLMVYVGTGSLLSAQDASNTDAQAIFAIADTGSLVSESDLLVQVLSEATFNDKLLRVSSENVFDPEVHLGWKVVLPVESEKLLGRPQLRGGRIQFVSTVTAGTYPEGWLNQLNYQTGGSSGAPLFDITNDGILSDADAVDGDYPVGRFLGVGNFSQPMLLRLGQGIDVSFVNGLRLPLPPSGQGLLFGGNIDVTSDSPSGPAVEPASPYPNPDNIFGESDGLSGNVDGHVHAYDKVHGVNYVDFFALEPRLGLARLDAVLTTDGLPVVAEPELNSVVDRGDKAPNTAVADLGPDQKFIVALTNADLSKGVELQIGCRTWNAYEYQNMLTAQLKSGTAPKDLKDTWHGDQSLVFTLAGIQGESCGDTGAGTLRLTVTDRVGKDGVLHATLPSCVNNTTKYDGITAKDPDTHPHITPVQEASAKGFRWRNGALTVQLLKVGSDGSSSYDLQDANDLPVYNKGNGGVYASAFTVSSKKVASVLTGPSGLLYEMSMFWHHGDMFDFQQSGTPPVCYGHPNYNANTAIDLRGINLGQYEALVSDAGQVLIEEEYAAALAAIAAALAAGDEDALNVALQNLGVLLQDPELANYHNLRSYAPGVVPVQHLLEIDRLLGDGAGGVAIDQTPAEVDDVSQDDNPTRGPNFVPGRRTWIDLRPE